jgi:hypothetical protein
MIVDFLFSHGPHASFVYPAPSVRPVVRNSSVGKAMARSWTDWVQFPTGVTTPTFAAIARDAPVVRVTGNLASGVKRPERNAVPPSLPSNASVCNP